MVAKRMLLCLLALCLIALAAVPAFADSIVTGDVVGDRYAITTMSGEGRALVSGSWLVSPVDLQLRVQVTYVGPHNIIFRVLSGTIQFDGKVYSVVSSGWRGDYNRDSNTCVCQRPTIVPNGQRMFFIIYGIDTLHVQQGTYMCMWSVFLDEDRIVWRIDLRTYRFKIH